VPIYLITTGISAGTSIIFSLIAWGLRGEVKSLRNEIQLARSGMQTEIAQAENRFYQRVNGNYVRKELHSELTARVDRVESRVDDLG